MKTQNRRLRKGRCVIALTVLILVVSLFFGVFSEKADASIINSREMQPVIVASGDTLWQLVEDYYNYEGDIRYAIHEVCEINSMAGPELVPGQLVYIPRD